MDMLSLGSQVTSQRDQHASSCTRMPSGRVLAGTASMARILLRRLAVAAARKPAASIDPFNGTVDRWVMFSGACTTCKQPEVCSRCKLRLWLRADLHASPNTQDIVCQVLERVKVEAEALRAEGTPGIIFLGAQLLVLSLPVGSVTGRTWTPLTDPGLQVIFGTIGAT